MANNTTGFIRIIKAAGYSWKGVRAAWINEAAFRQEGVAVVLAIIIAAFLDSVPADVGQRRPDADGRSAYAPRAPVSAR